jgi:hypothetical protein
VTRFYDLLTRGATIDAAAAGAGLDRELAAVMVDHFERAGLIGRASACTDCPSTNPAAPRRFGCAACPFAGRNAERRPGTGGGSATLQG